MLVEIPDPVYYVLEERAAHLHVDVDTVIASAMADITSGHHALSITVRQAVGMLVDHGLCDADIARLTHYTVGYVAIVRRRLGKAANRRYHRANPD
jgi:hypothetical protein